MTKFTVAMGLKETHGSTVTQARMSSAQPGTERMVMEQTTTMKVVSTSSEITSTEIKPKIKTSGVMPTKFTVEMVTKTILRTFMAVTVTTRSTWVTNG